MLALPVVPFRAWDLYRCGCWAQPFMEYYSACKLKAEEHHIDPDALDAFASKCQDTIKKYSQGAGH